jgi:hypothetical protein
MTWHLMTNLAFDDLAFDDLRILLITRLVKLEPHQTQHEKCKQHIIVRIITVVSPLSIVYNK